VDHRSAKGLSAVAKTGHLHALTIWMFRLSPSFQEVSSVKAIDTPAKIVLRWASCRKRDRSGGWGCESIAREEQRRGDLSIYGERPMAPTICKACTSSISRFLRLEFAKFEALQFAGGGLWKFGQEIDPSRSFVSPDSLSYPILQVVNKFVAGDKVGR